MQPMNLQDVADNKVLYLTTIGRRTGLPREIEIWFIVCRECFYLFVETREAAGWVKNIRRDPSVAVRPRSGSQPLRRSRGDRGS